jgi:hypothetical protein
MVKSHAEHRHFAEAHVGLAKIARATARLPARHCNPGDPLQAPHDTEIGLNL